MMLMRTDPFRELDHWTPHMKGTSARPVAMRRWTRGVKATFVIEFDLPGASVDSLNLDVERNVLTVRSERPERDGDVDMLAAERPRGVFSRQLFLGETLDTERIDAHYADGILRLTIPVAEKAKPRKIEVNTAAGRAAIAVEHRPLHCRGGDTPS